MRAMAMLLAQAWTGKIAVACTFCGSRGTLKGLIVAAWASRSILSDESSMAKASSAVSRAGSTVVALSSFAVIDWILVFRALGNSFIAASPGMASASGHDPSSRARLAGGTCPRPISLSLLRSRIWRLCFMGVDEAGCSFMLGGLFASTIQDFS